jgi:sulfur carrier protein
MEITINHHPHSVPEDYSVEQLVSTFIPDSQKGLAIAINQEIIPKISWKTCKLRASDNIMIIRASQGG